MKRGLHEPPLLAVKITIGGKQSISEEYLQVSAIAEIRLFEIARMLHQKVADMLRTEKRHYCVIAQAQPHHTPILALISAQKRERVSLKLQSIPHER